MRLWRRGKPRMVKYKPSFVGRHRKQNRISEYVRRAGLLDGSLVVSLVEERAGDELLADGIA
jgi:hypothetical protein